MKKTIQTKRNRTSGSSYRVLYAKTGRKRRLHAATATADPHIDLESDVANVGIGKALLVILVLHVLAIGAIYTHSKFFSDEGSDKTVAKAAATVPAKDLELPAHKAVAPTPAPTPAPVAAAPMPAPAPVIDHSKSRYIVVTGDTYNRIANVRNVDESVLRALNSNRPLRAGVVLDLPDELSSRPVAVSAAPKPDATPAKVETPERKHVRAVEVVEDTAPKAVVIKPKVKRPEASSGVRDSGQRYTVKSGDTVWRIASRYKVSRADLLKINGLSDPRKLGVGREIKIPAK